MLMFRKHESTISDITMADNVTHRQRQVLQYTLKYWQATTFWPTLEEVRQAFQFSSKNAVVQNYESLEKAGYMEKVGRRWRVIKDWDGSTVSVLESE